MNTNQQHDDAPADSQEVIAGLEKLSQRLDDEHFPGKAWQGPAAIKQHSGGPAWRVIVSIVSAAVAAAVVAALVFWSLGEPPKTTKVAGLGNEPPKESRPQASRVPGSLILLEDGSNSYSMIDVSSRVPVLSYWTGDSIAPVSVVPLEALASPVPPTTSSQSM